MVVAALHRPTVGARRRRISGARRHPSTHTTKAPISVVTLMGTRLIGGRCDHSPCAAGHVSFACTRYGLLTTYSGERYPVEGSVYVSGAAPRRIVHDQHLYSTRARAPRQGSYVSIPSQHIRSPLTVCAPDEGHAQPQALRDTEDGWATLYLWRQSFVWHGECRQASSGKVDAPC
jgi:hypothetical protein